MSTVMPTREEIDAAGDLDFTPKPPKRQRSISIRKTFGHDARPYHCGQQEERTNGLSNNSFR